MLKNIWCVPLFLLAALLPGGALATAQMGDTLIYNGQKLFIFSNPLESYFSEKNPRPNDLFKMSCTANWRGYVATWKVEDKALWLVKLQDGSCSDDAPEIPIQKVFPNQKGPIKATWFTGTLVAPQGKMLRYVHMGYESRYEKEIWLKFENGVLTSEETHEFTEDSLREPTPPPKPPQKMPEPPGKAPDDGKSSDDKAPPAKP